ncbi:hypothetical protein [Thermotoga sp.]|nr:hypothetical protein [Thermotoga sp.]MCD6551289.1 hypothetical protein [Thermotoga sp.]
MRCWIEAYRDGLEEKKLDPRSLLEMAEKEKPISEGILKSPVERMGEG